MVTESEGSDVRRTKAEAPSQRSVWRLPLGIVVAWTPLITIIALQQTMELPDVAVGAVVLLSLALAVAATLLLRPRVVASEQPVAAAPAAPPDGEPTPAVRPSRGSLTAMPELGPFDFLTELPTFHPFSQRLMEEFHVVQSTGRRAALVLVDVNHLERINDRFGAEVGDQVLRRVGACLRTTKRVGDILARMGDDEFGLLLPDCDDAGARAVVERVQGELAREPIAARLDGRSTALWVSICTGVAVCDTTSADADEVLTAAVDALNAAREELELRRREPA